MAIAFGAITRGTGKIFATVSASVPQEGRLATEARTRGGNPLPSAVFPKEKNRYVVVLPVLHAEIVLTVRVLDGNGSCIEEAHRSFGHALTAVKSKANTFLRNADALSIRNIDSRVSLEEPEVTVTHVIANGDDDGRVKPTDTVVCRAETFLPTEADLDAHYEIRVLDLSGKNLAVDGLTVLGDSTSPYKGSHHHMRVLQFSFVIPNTLSSFIVWLHYPDGRTPDGFFCMQDFVLSDMRVGWLADLGRNPSGPRYEDWYIRSQRTPLAELYVEPEVEFPIAPTYSVIVPLYKTPLDFFSDMAQSVLEQTYGKFELILVNASPEDADLKAVVTELASTDDRIKVVELEGNLGIALNTRAGIEKATGDFVCFFDHDDVLERDTLFEYTRAINDRPDTDMLYCDEDKLLDGHFVNGFLKPDFNWDYLYSCDFVCHMLAVRRSLIGEDDFATKEMDGAQDWYLTLRMAEKARNIYHVRKVLYHWRIHSESTASGIEAKPWVVDAQVAAVQSHFDRRGIPAKVSPSPDVPDFLQVDYEITGNPLVSIVIPNKDARDILDQCVTSIVEKSTYRNFEIIVVENNSTDPETFEYYKELEKRYGQVRIVYYDGGWNFSKICNFGTAHASGDYILLLNNDTEVITPDWLELMLGPCTRDEVGAVGAKLLYANDLVQHVGVIMSSGGPGHSYMMVPDKFRGYYNVCVVPHAVSAVTGACLLVKKSVYEEIGGLDEGFAVNYNDIDFCLKVNAAGKYVVEQPRAKLRHYESVTRGPSDRTPSQAVSWVREKAALMNRWADYYAKGDPYYNSNLERSRSNYGLPG